MKPYFAKYLPVEGKIKKGDKYIITKASDLGTKFGYDTGYIGTAAIDFLPQAQKDQEAKILKLFLCSRDIQVGDTVKALLTNNDFIVEKTDDSTGEVYYIAYGILCPARNAVKVIGEISPDATWVTEGMEFDRNDFEMRWTNSKGQYSLTRADVDRDTDEPILKAYIKGSCGHFH
jgi:hypothetical protein